jgi:hypothetical protein
MTSTASRPKSARSSPAPKRPRAPRLEEETPLLARIVAETICAEAAAWLEDDEPMRYAPALAARAVRLYARNPSFAKRLQAPGNTGREWLRVFLRHWLAARLKRHHRALFDRLPQSFALGAPIHP